MKKVVQYLLKNGLNLNHSGFDYLKKAIDFCLEDETLLVNFDKRLYKKLSDYYNISKESIVRALFYAICDLNEKTTVKKFIKKCVIELREI